VRVLYLTANPNLGSTTRTLQAWLLLGHEYGLEAYVGVQKSGSLTAWLATHRIPYQVNPMPWFDKRNPFRSLRHAWKVAHWARRSKVDLVHCNEHDVYPFGILVARLVRRPIVCHVRFQIAEGFCRWAFNKGKQPDALLWTSQQQRSDCAAAVNGSIPPNRQHVIHLGLDLTKFGNCHETREATRKEWGIRPNEIVLGNASALRPVKQIEDFVELVRLLSRRWPGVVGVLAGPVIPGDEGYRDTILRQIERASLDRRFRWLGNMEDIEPFHQAIDIYVSTSAYETFGMSVCEAMACRRPVVAYRGGSVHEVVGEAGLLVETSDLRGLTAGVEELVQDPQRRKELGYLAYQRVKGRFNALNSLYQVMQVYETILNGRQSVGGCIWPGNYRREKKNSLRTDNGCF
jgi:glycosyltransferase involved in cell wall biosynthesis